MTESTQLFKMTLTDQWHPETFDLVGQISIAFAQLEHVLWISPKRIKRLKFSIWDQIAGHVSVPERCNQIRQAYAAKILDQRGEADLDTLLKRVEIASKDRNSVIHARWGCKKKDGKIISRHRIWKDKDRGVDNSSLSALRDEIRALRDALGRYLW